MLQDGEGLEEASVDGQNTIVGESSSCVNNAIYHYITYRFFKLTSAEKSEPSSKNSP
jgi:hypothetical protein